MIPRRYLIASLFIAGMLLLLAIVQAPRSTRQGGVGVPDAGPMAPTATFEAMAELMVQDGWAPRFQGAQDPDQAEPWPFEGGFGLPWEPASPYLEDQGVALNGPGSVSEIALWRGVEWRRFRFPMPMVSARLEPVRGRHLLVTLQAGQGRFLTRLLEVPEGRVLWTADTGPWSRFSWDGNAVLYGLTGQDGKRITLATRPLDGDPQTTLAAWDEEGLPGPPRGLPIRETQLDDEERDLQGSRVSLPWGTGGRLWFPRWDTLWASQGERWTCWKLTDGVWRRIGNGEGQLQALPPRAMGWLMPKGERQVGPVDAVAWKPVATTEPAWPSSDPAWTFVEGGALTAWDQRWGKGLDDLPVERQREALRKLRMTDWKVAVGVRASVKGWLPGGPDIVLRERAGGAFAWVGPRILLYRLPPTERLRRLKPILRVP